MVVHCGHNYDILMKAFMKKTSYDIAVTFSLLHKSESKLTKLEKEAIARYKDD